MFPVMMVLSINVLCPNPFYKIFSGQPNQLFPSRHNSKNITSTWIRLGVVIKGSKIISSCLLLVYTLDQSQIFGINKILAFRIFGIQFPHVFDPVMVLLLLFYLNGQQKVFKPIISRLAFTCLHTNCFFFFILEAGILFPFRLFIFI